MIYIYHMHTYIHMYMFMYMNIHICIYIHTYIHMHNIYILIPKNVSCYTLNSVASEWKFAKVSSPTIVYGTFSSELV